MYINSIGNTNETTHNSNNTSTFSTINFDDLVSETIHSNVSTGSASLDSIFEKVANEYNIDVNLLKAVAKAESSFNPNATSKSGARGLMQLMPATAKYLGVQDSYDPYQNLVGGAKYLKEMLEKFDGNISHALAAYNAGPNKVENYNGIPPYKETQNYVTKVLEYMNNGVSVPNSTYNTNISNNISDNNSHKNSDMLDNYNVATSTDYSSLSFATKAYIKSLELQQQAISSLYKTDDNNEDSISKKENGLI